MDKRIKKYLHDISESIETIEIFIGANRDFNAYKNDKKTRRAVEREFEIIAEALIRIDRIDSNIIISNKKQIIGMRNRVIHGYDRIDNVIVWGAVVKHLPKLKSEVNDLISNCKKKNNRFQE